MKSNGFPWKGMRCVEAAGAVCRLPVLVKPSVCGFLLLLQTCSCEKDDEGEPGWQFARISWHKVATLERGRKGRKLSILEGYNFQWMTTCLDIVSEPFKSQGRTFIGYKVNARLIGRLPYGEKQSQTWAVQLGNPYKINESLKSDTSAPINAPIIKKNLRLRLVQTLRIGNMWVRGRLDSLGNQGIFEHRLLNLCSSSSFSLEANDDDCFEDWNNGQFTHSLVFKRKNQLRLMSQVQCSILRPKYGSLSHCLLSSNDD